MKNVIAFVLLTGLLFSFPLETSSQDFNKFLGNWSFNTPNAAYGYQTGTLTLTEEGSEIKGEVKFTDGYMVDLKEIEFNSNELSFSITVDYENIKVKMTLENDRLTGKVDTSEGILEVTAER